MLICIDYTNEREYYFTSPQTWTLWAIINLHDYLMYFLINVLIIVLVFSVIALFHQQSYIWQVAKNNLSNKQIVEVKLFLDNWASKMNFIKMYNKFRLQKFNHAPLIEFFWTITPTIMLIFMGWPSFKVLYAIEQLIDPIHTITVIGNQWYWTYSYSDFDIVSDFIRQLDSDQFLNGYIEEVFKLNTSEFVSMEKKSLIFYFDDAKSILKIKKSTPKGLHQLFPCYKDAQNIIKAQNLDGSKEVSIHKLFYIGENIINKKFFKNFSSAITFNLDDSKFIVKIEKSIPKSFNQIFPCYKDVQNLDGSKEVSIHKLFYIGENIINKKFFKNFSSAITFNLDDDFLKKNLYCDTITSKNNRFLNIIKCFSGSELSVVAADFDNHVIKFFHSKESNTKNLDLTKYTVFSSKFLEIFSSEENKLLDFIDSMEYFKICYERLIDKKNLIQTMSKYLRKFEESKLIYDCVILSDENLPIGYPRLLSTDQVLVLPAYVSVRILVTSVDVIHSWALPSHGIKMDAIPGRINQVSFLTQSVGTYWGQCSELCGINHGFMPIEVRVLLLNDYLSYISLNVSYRQDKLILVAERFIDLYIIRQIEKMEKRMFIEISENFLE